MSFATASPATRGLYQPRRAWESPLYRVVIDYLETFLAVPTPGPDPPPAPCAEEIKARGTRLVLVLNGIKTVDVQDAKLASGPFALQWVRGTIKFRKVEIKPL